jgi:hypothetical protein
LGAPLAGAVCVTGAGDVVMSCAEAHRGPASAIASAKAILTFRFMAFSFRGENLRIVVVTNHIWAIHGRRGWIG